MRADPERTLDLAGGPKKPGVGELDGAKENVEQAPEKARKKAAATKSTAAVAAPADSSSSSNSGGNGGSGGRKRKAATSLEDDIAAYKQDLEEVYVDHLPIDMSCGQVRGRINKLIDTGVMRKGEFCTVANVNQFLVKKGAHGGAGCIAYQRAWRFFKQREVRLKMPDARKRRQLEAERAEAAAGDAAGSSGAGSRSQPKAKTKVTAALPDISGVHLPGEEEDDVEVYDTCDEVRKKISAHLAQTPGLSQAQFCRDLYAQLRAPQCKGIQSKQLTDFRGGRGAITGARSTVFYAAYVYFEKLRVAEGKPKSAHRREMEAIWGPRGGLDRNVDHRTR